MPVERGNPKKERKRPGGKKKGQAMLTDDQIFWAMMLLAVVLILLCIFYRQLDSFVRLCGLPSGPEFPGIFWFRVAGISVGVVVVIASPLIKWLF